MSQGSIQAETAIEDLALPAIAADEIAFAMALFASAEDGRFHTSGESASTIAVEDTDLVDIDLPQDVSETTPVEFDPSSRAISLLWSHYDGDERQRTIWSRVVAFHAMLRKPQSLAVQRWIPGLNSNSTVTLQPAVVSAVAEAPLAEFGQFDPSTFVLCAERFKASSPAAPSSSFARPNTDRVLARLRKPIETLTGSVCLQVLISRAVRANADSYPWLKKADLSVTGTWAATPSGEVALTEDELAQGEAAVASSLMKSVRNLVGDGVAAGILAEVWGGESFVSAAP